MKTMTKPARWRGWPSPIAGMWWARRNGKEGMALLEPADANLLITDIVMPEKEGLEVLMELRSRRLPLKVIAMSGAGPQRGADYLHIARLLGAAKVLGKPFSADTLIAAVAAIPAHRTIADQMGARLTADWQRLRSAETESKNPAGKLPTDADGGELAQRK